MFIEPRSNRGKIMSYLGNTGSSGYKRLIDLNKLSEFVGVNLNKINDLCQNLKVNNKIDFYKISKDKAIMRINPRLQNCRSYRHPAIDS